MNKKKIVAIIAASMITFNMMSSIATERVHAYNIENRSVIMEEEIPQSQMTAVATVSQSGQGGDMVLDGNRETIWHTPWDKSAPLPQGITIDLGSTNNVSSIKVTPRVKSNNTAVDGSDNGIITKYEIYAIKDGKEDKVASGNWEADGEAKFIEFEEAISADSIRIVALEGVAGFATIAEVNVYRAKESVEKIAEYQNKRILDNNGVDISSDIESLKNLDQGTIIARFDSTKGDIQSLISIGNNTVANGHFNFYIADNKVGFEVRNQSGNVATGNVSVVLNEGINTVALKVTNGVGYKIFVNGVLAGEIASSSATISAGVNGVNNAFIGKTSRTAGSNEYPFLGDIDFVDVYGKLLTDKYLTEITGQTALPTEEEILPEGMKSEVVDIFKPGDLGSSNFRIPALMTTNKGTVISSIDVRTEGSADAPWNSIDSAVRRKPLNGEWEEAQKVIDLPGRASVIDTALVQDNDTDRIFLLVTTFPENYGFWQVEAGSGYSEINGVKYRSLYDASGNLYTIREEGNVYDAEGNITEYNVNTATMDLTKNSEAHGNTMLPNCELQVFKTSYLSLIYSDDDGVTWSEPVDINADVKADWMKFLGTGPGAGIQLKNGEHAGRIIFPVYYTNEHGFQSSATVYSDDHGATWNIGESPNDGRNMGNGVIGNSQTMNSGNELTECQVVEMPNGQVKMFMRNTGSYVRIATSFDGGSTWDSEVYEDRNLPEPYCQLSVMGYSQQIDGKDAIAFANPQGSERNNGTVRFGLINENGTHDNGEPRYEFEWRYSKLVKPGYYAYSCLTELPNGDIGLFYEGTDNKEMSYLEMSPEYIKFNYDESVCELINAAEIESVEILGDKESYVSGDKINVKLIFDQAVSLMGDKNLTLKIGQSEVLLKPISESNAREFIFEGILPSYLVSGNYGLILKANENTEILNVVNKKVTLSTDLELSEKGGQITIGKDEETPVLSLTTPQEVKVGDEFEVKVNVANIEDKYAMDFEVEFDSNKSELKSVGSVVEGKYFVQHSLIEPGKVRVIVAGLGTPIDSTSEFIKLVFKAKASGESVVFSTVNSTASNGEGEVVEVENGSSTLTILKNIDKTELVSVIEIANNKVTNEADQYTEASINALKEVIAIAQEVLDNTEATQEQVDFAKTQLQAAIDNLVEKEEQQVVDKKALKISIDYAESIKEEGKLEGVVPVVVNRFNECLDLAWNVYNNQAATKEEVKESLDNLIQIIHMLEFKQGDKTELKNLIDTATALNKNDYTQLSWNALEIVLVEANSVFADENAMQEEVNEIAGRLQLAIDNLEEKNTIDKSILEALINEVKDIDDTKYIPSTWIGFATALENANNVLLNPDVTQEQINDAYNSLLRAYLELRLTPDKSLLEGLIKEVQGLDLSKYTSESVRRLKIELANAEKVLNDDESTEKEVDEAISRLKKAKNSLVTSSDSNSENTNNESSSNNTKNPNSGNLPKTGTAGVASALMSGALSALAGLGLFRRRK